MWAQQEATSASFPAAGATFLIAGVIFMLGYRIAVVRRANRDYKNTKAAVGRLRKDFWATFWTAVKVGFWVFIGAALLVAWVAHDVRQNVAGP